MKFLLLIFVILSVLYVIGAQEEVNYVERGKTVILQCRPQSMVENVPTTYEWIDPRNNKRGSNVNLTIVNFSYEHVGTYTCKASQVLDGRLATTNKSTRLQIKDETGSNNFQVSVPQVYETYASGIIFIPCKDASGSSTNYRFEWTAPNGERQTSSSYFKNQVSPQAQGQYTCRMTRMSDNRVSEASTFVQIRPIPIKIEKVSGNMMFGDTVEFKCEFDKPKTDNKVFATFTYAWLDSSNNVVSNNQNLKLKLDDTTKFGNYHCRLTSPSMNPPYVQTQTVEIRFTNNPNTGGRSRTEYTTRFSSSPRIVRYFEPLELNCEISPPPADVTYEIYFNNRLISQSSRYSISRLEKSNMGVYQCVARGRDSNTNQLFNYNSTYIIQPEFNSGSKIELSNPPGPQIFVRAGDKRELHCEIGVNTGLQGKNAIWYFKGIEINPNDYARYNIQVIPRLYVSIMVLRNIQQTNEGKYECKVRGETKEAYIIVMSKSRNTEVSPSEQVRKVGDGIPVEFHCRVEGYQSKNRDVIWSFMSKETGQITNLEPRWSRSDDPSAEETSFIILNQAELKDAGVYICTEPQTRDTARATLIVESDLRIVVTPPIIKLRSGQTATFQCYVLGAGRSPDYPDFFMANGGRAADSQRTTIEKLEAGKVQLTYRAVTTNDNGTRFTCRKGRSTADVLVLVDPVCLPGSKLCRNAECIKADKFCDGKPDCADGSDEDQEFCRQCDPLSKRCENHNGVAPTNPIYQIHWACDGEDDCGNGFDEAKCYGNVLECGGLKYQCNDGTKSIPKAFVCDKDTDCVNGDDESRCVQPIIIPESSDMYKVNVRRGETVTLTCQVTGYPLPKVVWRFNWGCLTNERRMIVTESYRNCGATVSTLTISEFQPGDDGIYNCEALSGGKRAWSKDYQLLMNFRN